MTPLVVLTTVGGDFPAESFANEIIERRLAACVNIVENIRSIYRWQGKIETDDETLLVIKTTEERLAELGEFLRTQHPYQVPEIVTLKAEAEGPYRDWLLDAVAPAERQ